MNKLLGFVFVFLACALNAQTTSKYSAPGWELDPMSITNSIVISDFNREQAKTELTSSADKTGPYIFGKNYPYQYSITEEVAPQSLEDGSSIFRMSVKSNEALSLNFIFDRFYLPSEAELYLYSEDRSQIIGAYTSANNNEAKILGTELIESNSAVIELVLPGGINPDDVELRLSQVTCGFKSLKDVSEAWLRDIGSSEDCNIDVNCPLGNGWENQIRSVAMIVANGNGACTGALVNNTQNDGTPYFLTADHCGPDPTSWVFRFRWESDIPSCATTTPSGNGAPFYESVNGAVTRAKNAGSDFHLIELNSAPDPSWDVYYAGWDRTDNPVNQGTGIHHPSGDIKKICRDDDALSQTTWSSAAVWEVSDWDQGVTEPGSSGSPLFDQNGRIIGQLYGGTAACNGTNDNDEPDFYGRFAVSWNGPSAAARLSDWLDPTNSGVTVLDGYNPLTGTNNNDVLVANALGMSPLICNEDEINLEFKFRNNGFDPLTSLDIYSELNGVASLLTNWTGNLASGDYETINLPAISISDGNAQTLKVYTANPNGVADEDSSNDTLTFTFDAKIQGHLFTLEYYHDCFGSEISMEVTSSITGTTDWNLPQGSLQDNAWFGLEGTQKFCLSDTCGVLVINDAGGDGWNAGIGQSCLASTIGVYLNILNEDGIGIASLPSPDFGNQVQIDFCKSGFVSQQDVVIPSEVKIYPNPSTRLLFVDAPSAVSIEIVDMSGALVYTSNVSATHHEIELGSISNGIYLLKWYGNTTFGHQKWIKY